MATETTKVQRKPLLGDRVLCSGKVGIIRAMALDRYGEVERVCVERENFFYASRKWEHVCCILWIG